MKRRRHARIVCCCKKEFNISDDPKETVIYPECGSIYKSSGELVYEGGNWHV
jgi:hypothetical protein